jgi:RNA polymerase sigma-70 factor (sigma-E family)
MQLSAVEWSMMTDVEADKLQKASGQDFEAFFASTFPRARALARQIVGPSLAEDVAIEGLAKAYVHWNAVATMEYPEAWVLRVVTNAALDEVRRKKVYPREVFVQDSAIDFVRRESVVEALRRLSKRQREVVVLRYIVDLSVDEVARILGLSAGSVKTHLHRALPHLRDHLSEEELT